MPPNFKNVVVTAVTNILTSSSAFCQRSYFCILHGILRKKGDYFRTEY